MVFFLNPAAASSQCASPFPAADSFLVAANAPRDIPRHGVAPELSAVPVARADMLCADVL